MIRDLRLNEAGKFSWQELKKATQQENTIKTHELEHILDFYVNEPQKDSNENLLHKKAVTRQEEVKEVN